MYTTATAKDNFHDKTDRTADDIKDLKESVRRVKNDVRDVADGAKEDLQGIAREAGKRAHDFAHDLVDSAAKSTVSATDSIKTKMQETPFKTTAVALGIGFVIGMLFRRS